MTSCEHGVAKCICKNYNVKCVLQIWKEDGQISAFVYDHLTKKGVNQ